MQTALVTGASAGLGRELAAELARRRHALVLVARDPARLDRTAAVLRARAGVPVEVLPADLATEDGVAAVAARLSAPDAPVDVLVNNAGFGLRSRLTDPGSAAAELALFDVLARAVLRLTSAAVPGMLARGRGGVLTVSSVAAFAPGGTYPAAKAWAVTFTRGLAAELAGTGVRASVLCPGFVRTEFHDRAGLDAAAVPSWAWLDARRVAREGLDALDAGRPVCIPGLRYRATVAALRHAPLWMQDAVQARRGGRMIGRR